MNRDQLRKQALKKRNTLSPEVMQHFSKQIATHFLASKLYAGAQHIVCYLTAIGEVDCHPIIEQIFLDKKRCYLPVVDPAKKGQMIFIEYLEGDHLVKNKFGILEPENKINAVDLLLVDIVLAPLAAYDSSGNRLGMGAGYYDRALSVIKPTYCGLAYKVQAVDKIDKASWDVPLDCLVNEAGVLSFDV